MRTAVSEYVLQAADRLAVPLLPPLFTRAKDGN